MQDTDKITAVAEVLIRCNDHTYRKASVTKQKVVFDEMTREFSEYHGDEYLLEGQIVVMALVAE